MYPRSPVQALLTEIGDGIGCRHRYEVGSVNFDLLASVGMLESLRRNIPRCSEHGCPLIGECAHQQDFEERRSGRGNRKFRVTPQGKAAALDARMLQRLMLEHPLAALVFRALENEPTTTFALVGSLIEAATRELDDTGQIQQWRVSRREVGDFLTFLASLGMLVIERDGITIRSPA